MTPLLLSLKDASKALGMNEKYFRELVAAGEIPSVPVGKSKKFPYKELERFVEREQKACPSTGQKGRRTGTSTSKSTVYDFMDHVARKTTPPPKR